MPLDLKYRPVQLADVVGQPNIVKSLTKQAEQNSFSRGYIFAGHWGAGKTTLGRIVASLLNCKDRHGAVVCGKCRACQSIHDGDCPDVYEIDAASNNGIEEARALKERAYYLPQEMEQKVYLIDEAHMLTTGAWDALLKILEEPPKFVTFIFSTTEHAKIKPAIRSRCRTYRVSAVPEEAITKQLIQVAIKEKISIEPEAAAGLARISSGAMRDALGFLEEAAIAGGNKVKAADVQELFGIPERRLAIEIVRMISECNAAAVMLMTDDLIRHGADVESVLLEVSMVFRDLLLLDAGAGNIVYLTPGEKEVLQKVSKQLTRNALVNIAKMMGRIDKEINLNINPRMVLEAAFLSCVTYVTNEGAKTRSQT